MHTFRNSCVFPAQVGPDEVCVWRASLDQIAWDHDRFERLLSVDEREKSKRFVFERDRKRYAIGRAVLRIILARYLALQPAEISFRYEHYGKPMIDGANLSFNMSESAGCAVYALTRNRRIGVDIEQIRDIAEMDRIAHRFFSKPEYELLCASTGSMKQKTFFDFWTRKEALVKGVGAGLSMPLHTFDVSANPDEPIRLVRLKSDLGEVCQWALYDLGQNHRFSAALAVEWPFATPPRMYIFPSFWEENGGE
jgi:4'-phosphopantetheinyl transferase